MNGARPRPIPPETPFPRIERRRLVETGSLADEALSGRGEVPGLFATPPGVLPDAWPARASRTAGVPASAFTTTSDGAAQRLARIVAGEGAFVTTGQQPGLFLGPLYTLYKALTAIRIADDVERRSGRPALAVFWVASDDHDWEEVASCRIVGADENLRTLALEPPPGFADRSVGPAPLPNAVDDLLDVLREGAGGAVAGAPPPWLDALCEAYRPGRSFADAFVAGLAAALEGRDAAILDAAHPAVREASASTYREILERGGAVAEAMARGREAVRAAGHEPALTPPPDGLQVFVDDGTARRHVRATQEGFELGEVRLDRSSLLDRLETKPGRFSPAAALRPVLESRLLPVAATVLGPGEIAYWAQLRPLFAAFDVPMPRIMPRDAWILVEPRVDRLLERLELDAATVEAEGHAIDTRWIERSRPPAVADGIDSVRERLAEGFAELSEAVERELPGLKSAAGKVAHRAEKALGEFIRTVDARVREREEIALRQAARLRAHLIPGGRPQERAVAAAQFLARHGRGLVDDLLASGRVAGPTGQD